MSKNVSNFESKIIDLRVITSPSLISIQIHIVEDIGVEPMTPCVQGRCSGQLS